MSDKKTIDEILADFSRNLHEYANGRGTGLEFRVESDRAKQAIQALITDAQQNAVAWSIMVLDDLHTDGVDKYAMSADYDKFYKSAKNTIRDRYKNETGVDPAPYYPILSQLNGFNEGLLAHKKPATQKQFKDDHKEPTNYGEDMAVVVCATTIEKAAKLLETDTEYVDKVMIDWGAYDCDGEMTVGYVLKRSGKGIYPAYAVWK